MPTVNANRVELYVEELGEGGAILCIHGTSGSALTWQETANELAKRGRAIVYDRRGSFRSEGPEPYKSTDVSKHADDAAGLLDALSATPAIVIGRSYGGDIALGHGASDLELADFQTPLGCRKIVRIDTGALR